MQTFYLPVDGPALILRGRTFVGGITLIGQPTYGRFLFTGHGAVIEGCTFIII